MPAAGEAGGGEAGALEAAGGGAEVEDDGAAEAAVGEEEEAGAEKGNQALDVVALVQGAEYKFPTLRQTLQSR